MARRDAMTMRPRAASVASEPCSAGRFTSSTRRFITMSRMSMSPVSTLKMCPRLTASWVKVLVK